jgi:hypothetical protein
LQSFPGLGFGPLVRDGLWGRHKKPGAASHPGATHQFQFPTYTDFAIRVNKNLQSLSARACGLSAPAHAAHPAAKSIVDWQRRFPTSFILLY